MYLAVDEVIERLAAKSPAFGTDERAVLDTLEELDARVYELSEECADNECFHVPQLENARMVRSAANRMADAIREVLIGEKEDSYEEARAALANYVQATK